LETERTNGERVEAVNADKRSIVRSFDFRDLLLLYVLGKEGNRNFIFSINLADFILFSLFRGSLSLFFLFLSLSYRLKKLHKIKLLLPPPNLFHLSNAERKVVTINDGVPSTTGLRWGTSRSWTTTNNNVIGTNDFLYNQFGMKYFWQQIEDKIDVKDVTLINSKFFIEKIGIDIKSSVQLIYDIFTQMIEVTYIHIILHEMWNELEKNLYPLSFAVSVSFRARK
jgi:hypothetical protein